MHHIIQTEHGPIEYAIRGSGTPVLFLHGGHSNCRETLFQKGYDLDQFQLITPSRPGYGNTPLGAHSQPKAAAGLILSLLDQLKLETVIVVGISAGGLTAIELAASFPQRVSHLILISAVTKRWLRPGEATYDKGKKLFSPNMEKWSWALFRLFFWMLPRQMTKVLFSELSTKEAPRISKSEIAEIKGMTNLQRSGEGFVADLDQEIADTSIARVMCPTLILHSLHDKSVSIEMAHWAKAQIPSATLLTYDNDWGHLLWLGEASEEPIADVLRFIRP